MSSMDDIPIDPALLEEERETRHEDSDEALVDVADDSSGFDDDSDDAYIDGDGDGPARALVVKPLNARDDDAVFRSVYLLRLRLQPW